MSGAEDVPGSTERVRAFVDRTRSAPGTIRRVADEVAELHQRLDGLRHVLAQVGEAVEAGRNDTRGGVTAVGAELNGLDRHLDRLDEAVARVDGAVAGHAAALHRAVAAPARRAAAAALRDQLGPAPALRPGLSIFTLCWNHGALLEESVRSGLAVLDQLAPDEQGQVLVLDDASTDTTPVVAAALAASDPRVHVVRAPVNLGLALARTTLLHVAGTTHAFQLDADNTASPAGVADLYRVAVRTGAAVTYGTVVQVGPDGEAVGPVSNEPVTPSLFAMNYVDTMAVTDVAAVRDLGGWSPDPLLEHVDDWAAVRGVIEAGRLVAFVPTVVGRYRLLATAFHLSVSDPRIGEARVRRVLDPTGRRTGDDPLAGVAAVAYHPEAGPLWATPEAVALDPALAPPPSPPVGTEPARRRVLVVAPGGVANLGDDAITARGLDRVRAALGDVAVDLVTDGATPPPGLGDVRWLGPAIDVLPGLRMEELGRLDAALDGAAAGARIGEGSWRPLHPGAYSAAVLLGGGSLASGWSAGLLAPRALLAAALRTAGVPYACSGQGVGPLDGRVDRALAAGLLAGAAAVACRDEGSAAVARALDGVDPARVAVTGDDALGAAGAGSAWDGARPALGVTVRRGAYVHGAHGSGDDPARQWARAADAVAVARGWDVVGIALNGQDPEPEIATLAAVRATTPLRARWHLVDCGSDPRVLVATAGAVTAMAAQSFHAALFALAAGRPAVLGAATPYYRTKADGLAERAGLPAALAVTDPALLAGSLAEVEGALAAQGRVPLVEAGAAVDRWWAGLADRLVASG